MWIKEPIYPLEKSFDDKLNFVYKHDNTYVIDNHLAASWCWMNQVDVNVSHNLFHIDRHYDLLHFPNTVQTQIIDAGVDLSSLNLDQYLALRQPMHGTIDAALFRWDNYIGNLNLVYPNFFSAKYFATHNDGTALPGFIDNEYEIKDLTNNIDYWMSQRENKWILNLDIDYFFANSDNGKYQMLTDQYIIELCRNIRRARKYIAVITICLSPECCGGWDISIEKAKLICDVLGFDLPLNLDNIV